MAVAECVARGGDVPLSFGEDGLSDLLKFPEHAPAAAVAVEERPPSPKVFLSLSGLWFIYLCVCVCVCELTA
jgi:hypothetical protein